MNMERIKACFDKADEMVRDTIQLLDEIAPILKLMKIPEAEAYKGTVILITFISSSFF